MKQVNIHSPGEVRIDEVEEPVAGPGDAIVRVSACGICGSDLGYVKLGGVAGPTGKPMPLGHEFSGVVESIGEGVGHVAPGSRVVVNPLVGDNHIGNGGPEGAFAPRMLVRNAAAPGALTVIPDQLPMDLAALAEPLSVGSQAVRRVSAAPGEKVVVFGAGPIGLSAVATLRFAGIEDVVVVDLSERRLEIARKLGARVTLNPGKQDVWAALRDCHGTEPVLGAPMVGTDVYIEATGAAPVIGEVIDNAKSDARLSVVALHRTPIEVNFMVVMIKSLQIVGSMAYPDDWSETIEILTQSDLSPMITHRFALDEFHEALEVAQNAELGAKVMIVNDPS